MYKWLIPCQQLILYNLKPKYSVILQMIKKIFPRYKTTLKWASSFFVLIQHNFNVFLPKAKQLLSIWKICPTKLTMFSPTLRVWFILWQAHQSMLVIFMLVILTASVKILFSGPNGNCSTIGIWLKLNATHMATICWRILVSHPRPRAF
jgi:hypothetical protein